MAKMMTDIVTRLNKVNDIIGICSDDFLRGGQDIPEDVKPYYSPSTAKTLGGLPSTFIIVGNMDLFCVEDYSFAQRLVVDGVPWEFHQIYGVYHGFDVVEPNSPQTLLLTSLQEKALARMLG